MVGSSLLHFGPWTLDLEQRRLKGPGGEHRLEPKVAAVLRALIEREGAVVSRDDLLRAAWGPELATADVLSRAISDLRRVLGDDTKEPSIVRTVRGQGYTLAVPQTAGPVAQPAHRGRRRGVAFAIVVGAGAIATIWVTRWSGPAGAPFGAPVPLTSLPGEERDPAISPDERRVAYAWTPRDGAWGGAAMSRLMVQDLDGNAPVQLTRDSAEYRYPAWSPDGRVLAAARRDSAGWGVYQVGFHGQKRLLVRLGGTYVLGLTWSPRGDVLAVSTQDAPLAPFSIRLVDVTTLGVSPLTDAGGAVVGDAFPTFSPDGTSLAFARFGSETDADIWVVARGGGPARRLTTEERPVTAVAFSPDGHSILYSADRWSGPGLWKVAVDGGAITRVGEVDRPLHGLAAGPSGALLVAEDAQSDIDVWAVDASGGKASAAIVSTRVDALPSVSPDGSRIAFQSDRSGTMEVWAADRDGTNSVRLTNLKANAAGPQWSPDGGRIAFIGRPGGASHTGIYVLDVATGRAERWTPDSVDAFAAHWSLDGHRVYFAAWSGGRWNVWRKGSGERAPQQVTTEGGVSAQEAEGGRTLLYTKPGTNGLWKRDLATGVDVRVVTDVPAADWTNWVVSGSGDALYYVRRGPQGEQQLVSRKLEGGEVRVIASPVRVPAGLGGVAIAPDGKRLYFGALERREADLIQIVRRSPRAR
jgi:Tol biopolymer transport system component